MGSLVTAMIHERDIRERVAALLMDKLSLAAFEQWIGAESWGMFSDSSEEAVRLVAQVNLLVSEFHDDVIDDHEFRHLLSRLLNDIVDSIVVEDHPPAMPYVNWRSASPSFWVQPSHRLVVQLS